MVSKKISTDKRTRIVSSLNILKAKILRLSNAIPVSFVRSVLSFLCFITNHVLRAPRYKNDRAATAWGT